MEIYTTGTGQHLRVQRTVSSIKDNEHTLYVNSLGGWVHKDAKAADRFVTRDGDPSGWGGYEHDTTLFCDPLWGWK